MINKEMPTNEKKRIYLLRATWQHSDWTAMSLMFKIQTACFGKLEKQNGRKCQKIVDCSCSNAMVCK